MSIADQVSSYSYFNTAGTTSVGPKQGGCIVYGIMVPVAWTGGTVQLFDGGTAITPALATTTAGPIAITPSGVGLAIQGQLSITIAGTPGTLMLLWNPY
jgi:hypothetical protein